MGLIPVNFYLFVTIYKKVFKKIISPVLILFFCISIFKNTQAQQTIPTRNTSLDSLTDGLDLTGICNVFIDSSKSLSADQISQKEFSSIDLSGAMSSPFAFGKQNVWFKITIENTEHDTLKAILLSNRIDKLILYQKIKTNFVSEKSGFGYPEREISDRKIPYGFRIAIPPFEAGTYFLKLESIFKLRQPIKISLFTPRQYENYKEGMAVAGFPLLIFQWCFLACMLFMFLFSILQFSSNYYRGYVFYALFILFNFLIFLRILEYNADLRIVTAWLPQYYYCFENILTAVALIFYLKFIEYFLETKLTQKYFQKFINIALSVMLFLIVLDIIIVIIDPYAYFNSIFFAIEKIINYSLVLAALIQVFFNKNILTRYIVIGTITLLLGLVYASYLGFSQTEEYSAFMLPSNFAECGVLLEILFFSVGLGHKSHLSHNSRKIKNSSNK